MQLALIAAAIVASNASTWLLGASRKCLPTSVGVPNFSSATDHMRIACRLSQTGQMHQCAAPSPKGCPPWRGGLRCRMYLAGGRLMPPGWPRVTNSGSSVVQS